MNNLQLTKIGVDDFAVALGNKFPDTFRELMINAIDPLKDELRSIEEINSLLNSKSYPEFKYRNLPSICKEFLEWASGATFASDQAILMPLLTLCGAVLRKSVQIKNPTNWIYPNVWTLIVGKSGSGKSTGVDYALKFLRPLDKKLFDEHKPQLEKYEAELEQFEKNKKKKKNKEDLKAPIYPPCRALSLPMVSSLERYVEIFACDTPSGLINTSEEMAVWLVNLNKVDNLKEFITGTYAGQIPPNLVSYKNARHLRVDQPITSILGPSTLDWIFNNFTKNDYYSGFFQRLNYVINNTSKEPKARPKFLEFEQASKFSSKLEELYNFGLQDVTEPIRFEFNEESWEYFEEIFNDLQQRKKQIQDDIIISCLDRYYNELLFKYCLILHCMSKDFYRQRFIELDTLKAALDIVKYLEESMMFTLSELENKHTVSMMKKIIDKLRKTEEFSIKSNILADDLQGYARHKDSFNTAIEELLKLKIIERKNVKNKSNNQVVNPSI